MMRPPARARRIIAVLKRTPPGAKLPLGFSSPLEPLVALILAAECPDGLVNPVPPAFVKKYRAAQDWIGVEQEDVSRINFYRNKTRSIRGAGKMLVENFDGKVPANMDDLLTLPGVGRKTANAVLANAFGQ